MCAWWPIAPGRPDAVTAPGCVVVVAPAAAPHRGADAAASGAGRHARGRAPTINHAARGLSPSGDSGSAAPSLVVRCGHILWIMTAYRKNPGAVFSLKYHVVWCPKYRRPVLVGPVAERLEALLREKTSEDGLIVHALEVMPDHVHLFVEGDPTWAPAALVGRLKGYSSHVRREEFPHRRSRLPTLWSRSYYAGTGGHVSAATVGRSIESPKGR